MATATSGLEGVVAADSRICFIDGFAGVLAYCGYDIRTLAEQASFEEVIYLLWHGRLPAEPQLAALRHALVWHRSLPNEVIDLLKAIPNALPMDALRTAVSLLGALDPRAKDHHPEADLERATRLMAQTATIVTTFERLRKGLHIIQGDPKLSFAGNFLYCLTGSRPELVSVRAMDAALTLHADHELNASTFAGRVAAATLADLFGAVTGAIAALKGPLHGGANEDVYRLLNEAGRPERAEKMILALLAAKKKVPGFGHRVYRTEDPRASVLRNMSEELGKRNNREELYATSRAIEETMRREKPTLYPNVDFYSASTYAVLGIAPDLFTPIFAVSRMAGWTAHALEQYANNRLIRPRAEYRGAPPSQPWIPLDQRRAE